MNPFDKVTLELNRKITSLAEENAALKSDNELLRSLSFRDELDALKGQVENLSALWEIAHVERSEAMIKLTTLQSKSDALVDAMEMYFKQYPYMMKGYIADALAAFKDWCDLLPDEQYFQPQLLPRKRTS